MQVRFIKRSYLMAAASATFLAASSYAMQSQEQNINLAGQVPTLPSKSHGVVASPRKHCSMSDAQCSTQSSQTSQCTSQASSCASQNSPCSNPDPSCGLQTQAVDPYALLLNYGITGSSNISYDNCQRCSDKTFLVTSRDAQLSGWQSERQYFRGRKHSPLKIEKRTWSNMLLQGKIKEQKSKPNRRASKHPHKIKTSLKFAHIESHGMRWQGNTIENARITRVHLNGGRILTSTFRGGRYKDFDITNGALINVIFDGVDFGSTHHHNNNFDNSTLDGVGFIDCQGMHKTTFRGAYLKNVVFSAKSFADFAFNLNGAHVYDGERYVTLTVHHFMHMQNYALSALPEYFNITELIARF